MVLTKLTRIDCTIVDHKHHMTEDVSAVNKVNKSSDHRRMRIALTIKLNARNKNRYEETKKLLINKELYQNKIKSRLEHCSLKENMRI